MSKFIPISSVVVADLLSRRLFELSRPQALECKGCTTTHLLSWIVHPVSGSVMMEIPEGYNMPVHQIADGETVRPIVQPFVTAGKVTKSEVDGLVALVRTKIGERLAVWDIIPNFWKEMNQTREQLVADGWFGNSLPK